MWHPDKLSTELAWSGSGCTAFKGVKSSTFFNPLAHVPEAAVVRAFKEPLPVDDSELQWCVVCVVVCQCLCKPNKAVVRSFTKTLLVDDCELQW